ncbi:MAG: PilZ domain-containing protein [Candidatus Zixiibacteriota bacterium]|nr:MAG: PilZ domain-containing protein [candidate division Zixibacteria bacterium]
MRETDSKVTSDIAAGDDIVSVRPPFRLLKDRRRRYIRLEISQPIEYSVLKDRSGGFWGQGDGPSYRGSILNISAGGVLMIGDTPLDENTMIVMKMTLQDVEILDRVIGVIKRAEPDEGEWLIGVEFITRESLVDYLSAPEYEMVREDVASFDEMLRGILNKYVYYRRVSNPGN